MIPRYNRVLIVREVRSGQITTTYLPLPMKDRESATFGNYLAGGELEKWQAWQETVSRDNYDMIDLYRSEDGLTRIRLAVLKEVKPVDA